jgi:hypothetical protein
MEDTSLVKQLLFSQQPGRRHRQRPRLTLRRAMEQDVRGLNGGQPKGRSRCMESQHPKHWQEALLFFQTTGTASAASPGGSPSTPAGGSAGASGSGSNYYRSLSRT